MKLDNYLTRDLFYLNNYKIYPENYKIKLFNTDRTISFKMFFEHNYDLMDKFEFAELVDADFSLYIEYDENMLPDAYKLKISTKKYIRIQANNLRGIRYAFYKLNELYKDNILPYVEIYDEPSFKIRGVIEGFYGTPWDFNARLDLISFMDKHRLNTYMYAPKSDIYHRLKWQELYPENELENLIQIKEKCESYKMDFYYCISPGYAEKIEDAFKFTDEEFDLLFKKLDQVLLHGVKNFGLLLDDIDYKLSKTVKVKFERPGQAHAYICNKVYDYIKSKNELCNLIMCPTEYHQLKNSEYKNDLKKYMNKDINVFFTGDNVCAEVITKENILDQKNYFGHDIYIWDNYPVNDFITTKKFVASRIYTGPIENRSSKLNTCSSAYVINPMIQIETSKIGIATMADYAWNTERYNKDISFINAIKEFGLEFYEKSKAFLYANDETVMSYGSNVLFKSYVENNSKLEIEKFYNELLESCNSLLKMDLKITDELNPWLIRGKTESEFVLDYLKTNEFKKEELIKVVSQDVVLGCELLDYLIIKYDWLTKEEFNEYVKKKRGNLWWRIFNEER